MRTRLILVALVCFIAAWLPAQEAETIALPWAAPVPDVDDGAQLIAIGFWGDVIGIGLMAGSSAAYSLSFGAGQTLFELGLVSMLLVGEPLSSARAERPPRRTGCPRGDKSRRFSRIAMGCGGGAVALGLGAAVAQSTGLAIGSIVVGAAGAVFEIINFYSYRPSWANDMKVAAGLVEP